MVFLALSINGYIFQVYFWIGWKPDPTQPKALKPQQSDVSLKDIDRLEEIVKKKTEDQNLKKDQWKTDKNITRDSLKTR